MIELPDFSRSFDYENMFYLSCDSSRIRKILTQYLIFKQTIEIRGDIVECGVFKGASFFRFSMFRKLHGIEEKKLIGFDAFGAFPETSYEDDMELREKFINTDGVAGIKVDQLKQVLKEKDCDKNVDLVEGDICQTVPEYIKNNPDLKISFLNLDVDIYEPSSTILEYLYPRIVKGGVLLLDDYNEFPGETKAVDDYFKNKNVTIKESEFNATPYYIVKN